MTWAVLHLVVDGDERVVRGERPGGAFTVDQQGPLLPVHHVLFHFGDVVRNVVNDVHVEVVRRGAEHFGKSLKDKI